MTTLYSGGGGWGQFGYSSLLSRAGCRHTCGQQHSSPLSLVPGVAPTHPRTQKTTYSVTAVWHKECASPPCQQSFAAFRMLDACYLCVCWHVLLRDLVLCGAGVWWCRLLLSASEAELHEAKQRVALLTEHLPGADVAFMIQEDPSLMFEELAPSERQGQGVSLACFLMLPSWPLCS